MFISKVLSKCATKIIRYHCQLIALLSAVKETRAERVKYFSKYMEQLEVHRARYTPGLSKTFRQSYWQQTYGYGGGFEYWVVGSHKAPFPLELGLNLDTNVFGGYQVHIVGGKSVSWQKMWWVVSRVESGSKACVKAVLCSKGETCA